MKRLVKNKKGITLVELLIYLGLSTIMLLVVSELFMSILDESVENQNYSTVQNDGRYIMARLRYQINNADTVTLPVGLGDISNELRITTGGVVYRFYTTDEKFYLNDGSGEFLMSSPDSTITDVSFTKLGNTGGKEVVDISFKVSSGESGTARYESTTFKGAGGRR